MKSFTNPHLSKKERTKLYMYNKKMRERRATAKKNHRIGLDHEKVPINTVRMENVEKEHKQKRKQEYIMYEDSYDNYIERFGCYLTPNQIYAHERYGYIF
jgi:hypothetical protein